MIRHRGGEIVVREREREKERETELRTLQFMIRHRGRGIVVRERGREYKEIESMIYTELKLEVSFQAVNLKRKA